MLTQAQQRERLNAHSARKMLEEAIEACPPNALPMVLVDALRKRGDLSDGDLILIGNNVGRIPGERVRGLA